MSTPQKIYEWNGQRHTINEWSKIIGISPGTLRTRINRYKWPLERALTKKPDKRFCARVTFEKYEPKPKKVKIISECDSRCRNRCLYGSHSSGGYTCCMYAEIEHHRRGCPAGKECTRFTTRKKRKPNNNGLIRMTRREA